METESRFEQASAINNGGNGYIAKIMLGCDCDYTALWQQLL